MGLALATAGAPFWVVLLGAMLSTAVLGIMQETLELETLIRKVNAEGVPIVLIEHKRSLVMSLSARVTVLNFGQKIAEGPPARVREDPKVIEAYLR